MLNPGKNHPGHPEEDDVPAADQHAGRIIKVQISSFFGPAQGGKRPQGAGKPGVQNIFVLHQVGGLAFWAVCRISPAADHLATVLAVPHRDAVPPPQLTADAPVTDVLHPIRVDAGKAFRHKAGLTGQYPLNSRFGQRLHFNKPLRRDERLDDSITALAMPHRMLMIFDFQEKASPGQVFHHPPAAFITAQALVGPGILIHDAMVVHDCDLGQVMAQPHFEIVGIVGRSNLYRAGSKFAVNITVRHHRDQSSHQRQYHLTAYHMLIAAVFGVNRHPAVTQHGLRSGSSHHYIIIAVLKGIFNVPQLAGRVFMLDFYI